MYDKLIEKVNKSDASGFISKTKLKKIPDVSELVKKNKLQ